MCESMLNGSGLSWRFVCSSSFVGSIKNSQNVMQNKEITQEDAQLQPKGHWPGKSGRRCGSEEEGGRRDKNKPSLKRETKRKCDPLFMKLIVVHSYLYK
jgi:hypothetical protein